eukprot:GHVO01057910.1.p2 GENE.GHVO01057910.1~~GHVO01057910.1.p2  ORF type:complete len:154 (-),score=52.33 GHVO01057910.1:264-725(-)
MLAEAFKQGHTFSVGTSLTTGRSDVVVWNGIHHKTSPTGGIQMYGYPDSTYMTRVTDELKQFGIVSDDAIAARAVEQDYSIAPSQPCSDGSNTDDEDDEWEDDEELDLYDEVDDDEEDDEDDESSESDGEEDIVNPPPRQTRDEINECEQMNI